MAKPDYTTKLVQKVNVAGEEVEVSVGVFPVGGMHSRNENAWMEADWTAVIGIGDVVAHMTTESGPIAAIGAVMAWIEGAKESQAPRTLLGGLHREVAQLAREVLRLEADAWCRRVKIER